MGRRLVVSYSEGSWIIAGDLEEPGLKIRVADPWGNLQTVVSGDKPEWGRGGFEVVAPHPAERYTIDVGGEVWHFEHKPGVTYLTWRVEDVEPEPDPEPEPEPDPDKGLEFKAGGVYSALLDGEVVRWVEGEREDALWVLRGYGLPGARLWLPREEPAWPLVLALLSELQEQVARMRRGVDGR